MLIFNDLRLQSLNDLVSRIVEDKPNNNIQQLDNIITTNDNDQTQSTAVTSTQISPSLYSSSTSSSSNITQNSINKVTTPTTPLQQQLFWHHDISNELQPFSTNSVTNPSTPTTQANGSFNKIYCQFCKAQYIFLNGEYIQCFCGIKLRSYLQHLDQQPQNSNISFNKSDDLKMVKVCQTNGTNSMQTVPLKEFRRMIGLKDNRRHSNINNNNNNNNNANEINQQNLNRNLTINFNRTLSLQQPVQPPAIQPQYINSSAKSLPVFNSNRQLIQQSRWQQPTNLVNTPLNLTNHNHKQMNGNNNFKFFQQQSQLQQVPHHIFENNQNHFVKNNDQQYSTFQVPHQQQFGFNGVAFDMRQLMPPSQNNILDGQHALLMQHHQANYSLSDHYNYLTMQRYGQAQPVDLQNLSSSSSSSSSTSSASSTVQQHQQQFQAQNSNGNMIDNNNTNINQQVFSPTSAPLYMPINQPHLLHQQANLPNMILSSLNDEIKYKIF